MMPTEFRAEMLRLTAAGDSEAVLRLHELHGAALAGQLSPEEFEDVYGVALPLAHFRLFAMKHHPDLAMHLGLLR